ncbi:hypothetical protein AGABI1DRAFT_134055 [Agaricus bisporus var. burnettii JB137-S8]|uniref:Uncharacterized protein n=1 Tax=Agaricus bisporus var. burnettii (strain JB137-S8 / ATCC MYA-4627 / FGSC 10392) TaxID=597362 RepID=K5XHB5_AGABU|nr:uncharacterized protein AGABI1DRAFT_134055 [Agaricus bisporus var. burnettii JB137-S8]EKM73805.1 hypothetical protein AGABI1DRAFT_134055 [Agaricus bisporus var. burnettii JB137-S8]
MTRSPYFSSPVLNYSTSPYPADEVEAIRTEKEQERRARLRGALQRMAIGHSTLTGESPADRRRIVSSRAGRVFSTPTATAQASRHYNIALVRPPLPVTRQPVSYAPTG